MKGFIYIMSNPAYPGSLKIGQTSKDPEERRKDLGSTGVLEDFVLEYYAFVEDYELLEIKVHKELNDVRYKENKEFFKISVPEAIKTIRRVAEDRIEFEKDFSKQGSVSNSNRNKVIEFLLAIMFLWMCLYLIFFQHL
jgi:hypothetical protein